jgi:aminoglycoside phosphotransferase family enzyme
MSCLAPKLDSNHLNSSNENIMRFVKNTEMEKCYSETNFSNVNNSKENENIINITQLIDKNIQKNSTKIISQSNEYNSYFSENYVKSNNQKKGK